MVINQRKNLYTLQATLHLPVEHQMIENISRAPAPHLDYHQNDQLRQEFFTTRPLPVILGDKRNEPNLLMGEWDSDDYKFEVLLGVWKPISPEKVSGFGFWIQ